MTERARKIRLTDAGVGRLRPRKTEYVVWDSQVAGLGVRVRPSGHPSLPTSVRHRYPEELL